MNTMDEAFKRIIEQAQAGLYDLPFQGWIELGLHGLTAKEMRMGNIEAIVQVALREGA